MKKWRYRNTSSAAAKAAEERVEKTVFEGRMTISMSLDRIVGKHPAVVTEMLQGLGIDTNRPYIYYMGVSEVRIEQDALDVANV
ncbi:MAG: hypothetical protein BA864_14990 [Desulfuromonadales bacterium C00003093]|nr:MAG: hypothetical protein BA864_14990 [Desulfuromonadales bacterium C00003093]